MKGVGGKNGKEHEPMLRKTLSSEFLTRRDFYKNSSFLIFYYCTAFNNIGETRKLTRRWVFQYLLW
jgi:hypothetical protein